MKQATVGILLVIFPFILRAEDPVPQEVFFLPWGNGIEYREAPGGRFGPRSFRVVENQVYLLNTNQNQIDRVTGDSLSRVSSAPPYTDDFTFTADKSLYVLHDHRVSKMRSQGKSLVYKPPNPTSVITGIQSAGAYLAVYMARGETQLLDLQKNSAQQVQGKYLSAARSVSLKKIDSHTIEVENLNNQTVANITFSAEYPLGSVQLAGIDSANRLYVVVDFITQQVPLQVQSRIYIYDADYTPRYVIEVPDSRFTYLFRQYQVTEDGKLYHLISAPDGLYLYRWDVESLPQPEQPLHLQYPSHLNSVNINFNDVEMPEYMPELPKDMPRMDPAEVTREEALATGDTYVQHTWDCQSFNMTNGTVTAPDGDLVTTPGWLSVGTMQKVPYQWGGFRSLSQFDSGIAGGGYAGDIHTSGVTSYAYGVDCSGFVSRCWNLPYQYSTSMMPQITGQYSSWDDLLPADAIHRVGHVRMMVSRNANGTLNVVESSGADWRVSYRAYAISQLSTYTPRYYVNMEGAPTVLPTPLLTSVLSDSDRVNIQWQCDQFDSVAGYHLYHSNDGTDWNLAQPLSVMPLDMTSVSLDILQNSPGFYRLMTVDEADTTRESIQSDTYGSYSPEGAPPPVLIVDGFDRYSGSGSWGNPYHSFAMAIGKTLAGLNIPFETCTNEAVESQTIQMENYNAVIWLLGDESTVDETFNTEEQARVKAYLEQGGQLFVSGSEIGWDLDYKGDTGDRNFYNQYLKADYSVDDTGIYTVTGITGTIFQDVELQYDNGSHDVYEEDYPDGVSPTAGGVMALQYNNSSHGAAIQYQGTFGNGTTPGKLVYLAFPVETIYSSTSLSTLLARITNFFGYSPAAGLENTPENVVNNFQVMQNYPNPFNPETTLTYNIPAPGEVLVTVYDLRGAQIFSATESYANAGKYTARINLSDAASGNYFARVTWVGNSAPPTTRVHKMVYLK